MKTYSVVVVDDHVLLSQAITGLVESFDQFRVSFACRNGQDFLDRLKASVELPDLVLMDISMPVLNGIQTTQIISEVYPSVKVVALTILKEENTIIKMLKAGAKSYLLKDIEKEELEMALTDVMTKGYYHTKMVSDILVKSLIGESSEKKIDLKHQEVEFIKYVCSELTYKEIAENMYRSPKTIDGYRDTLFKKLQVRNKIGLVKYAIKNKLFTP